jgi:cytoskeletal protein CcmA (bactofilin family)
MFRRKKDDIEPTRPTSNQDEISVPEPKTFPRPASAPAPASAIAPTPVPPRSPVSPPISAPPRPGLGMGGREAPVGEGKRLQVGREITLSGQITSCDRLIIEGKVEATLVDTHTVEIAESGMFKGNAEIDNADIAGRFEGALTVRGKLTVRATGRLHGKIRYGTIEIEAGGEIAGEVEVAGKSTARVAEARPSLLASDPHVA